MHKEVISSNSKENTSNPILKALAKPIQKGNLDSSSTRISQISLSNMPKHKIPKDPAKWPMSSDEIEKCSILKSWQQKMPQTEKNDQNQGHEYGVLTHAANIIGGGLITGGGKSQKFPLSSLDGLSSPQENYELWEYLIEDIKSDIPKEVPEGLARLKTYSSDLESLAEKPINETLLHKLSEKYAYQIQALKVGESVPLHGGWRNAVNGSGHAVIYEFTRVDKDHFDVSIITSTGLQLVESAVVVV